MKTIENKDSSYQTRELANLLINKCDNLQSPNHFMVQLDDFYAVDEEGTIYQLIGLKENNLKK